MIQAIQYLPQSPLINLILYPKVEAFQLPKIEVHNHQLITKVKLPKVYGTQVSDIIDKYIHYLIEIILTKSG